MGEVYRARDTRLDRTVAIKVLPPQAADNPEARQRFEREARAVSSLNHPNICALYDVGQQDGTDFLVMEYLEGESLGARLASGPLPVAQAIDYAVQIAQALAEAHRHGVSHRDLKPGNIMLTKSGAKLLDFGLAKLRDAAPEAPAGLTLMPTRAKDLTQAGTILGTLQYMAPEQLEGKEADARSDIFAFGAVLYEMLTGRKAFEAKSQASLIVAILEHEPPPLAALQPTSPAALDRVVRTCLAKDPDERWQSAADLARELKWMVEGRSQIGEIAPVTAAAPRRRLPWPWVAATAALLLACLTLALVHFRETPPRQPTIRFQIPVPEKETIFVAALSPDGERLAFTSGEEPARRRLWVRPLNSLTPQALPGTEGAGIVIWSPDSRAIAFVAGGKLKKIDLLGGPPLTLCDAPNALAGGWNRDGVILFGSIDGNLRRVSAAGGESRPVTTLDSSLQETMHAWPQFLPDGEHFLYTAYSSTPANAGVRVASLDSKASQRLVDGVLNAAYTHDAAGGGYLLFTREETLLAQPFDASRLQLAGEPFPVAESVSVGFRNSRPFVASFSASASGVLAYERATVIGLKQLAWVDRNGRFLNTVGEPADYSNPALSPDEKRLAVGRLDPQTKSRDVWIFDLVRGASSRFTFDRADDFNPVWSPDGNRLAFSSDRKGHRNLYLKDAAGTGEEQALLESDDVASVEGWSQDGRFILFNSNNAKKPRNDVEALAVTGDRKRLPLLTAPYTEDQSQASPNGRWLAYRSNESRRNEVYVQSFPGLLSGSPAGKWQISTAGGLEPQWRRDGKELFYLSLDNKLMAVEVRAEGAVFEAGVPKALFEMRLDPAPRKNRYLPAANGQRFLVVQLVEQATSAPINVVVNWSRPGGAPSR
jgi:Tol biopolymer transport system component/predicted Ser/Thr protein kinase